MDKRKKLFVEFAPSEMAVYRAAADIFAGYVAAGAVNTANEADMMRKSVSNALLMAEFVDDVVVSDNEADPEDRA